MADDEDNTGGGTGADIGPAMVKAFFVVIFLIFVIQFLRDPYIRCGKTVSRN
jgi:hypothetical protein